LLGLFRRNLISNLITVAIFCFLLHVYYFIDYQERELVWPSDFTASIFGFIPQNILLPVLSAFLIIAQALYLNHLVIKHKLSRALSTIPAAIFVLYAVTCLEPVIFHPILLANLFALLSLGCLFKIYKKHLPLVSIFNSGLYMTIAMLIYPAYHIFLLLLILGLFSLRNLSIKEVLQLLFGCMAPLYFVAVYFFYTGNLALPFEHFSSNLSLPWSGVSYGVVFLKVGIVLLLILAILFFSTNVVKKKKYDAIKKIELSYWMLFLTLFTLFLTKQASDSHLLIASIPITIIGGLYMESKSNTIFKEFLFLLFLGGFVVLQLGIV